jgi:hypothetical protein
MNDWRSVRPRGSGQRRTVADYADFLRTCRQRAAGSKIADYAALNFGKQNGDFARREQWCDVEWHCCLSPFSVFSNRIARNSVFPD